MPIGLDYGPTHPRRIMSDLSPVKLHVDASKKTMALTVGPFTVTLPWSDPVHSNSILVSQILEKTFLTRRVFWRDPRMESWHYVVESFEEVRDHLDAYRQGFAESAARHPRDKVYYDVLTDWWRASVDALQELRDAIKEEGDPAESGSGGGARDYLPGILVKHRFPSYKAAAALRTALPPTHRYQREVADLIAESKNIAAAALKVPYQTLASADVEESTLVKRLI